jgi:hypothetical protein
VFRARFETLGRRRGREGEGGSGCGSATRLRAVWWGLAPTDGRALPAGNREGGTDRWAAAQ